MSALTIADGSFRDPHARLFVRDGRLFRALDHRGRRDWEAASNAGLIAGLIEDGLMVRTVESDQAPPAGMEDALVLESDLVRPITYPYEWSFLMLRDAALVMLEITERALEAGIELKDATAYNVVFSGTNPVFVDAGSFAAGFSGHWRGYAQFCDHFLAPLMVQSYLEIPFQSWLRGSLEGIPIVHLAKLMGFGGWFKPGVAKHVKLRARLDKSVADYGSDRRRAVRAQTQLPVEVVIKNVESMRRLVGKLSSRLETEWASYGSTRPYQDDETAAKRSAVHDLCALTGGGDLAWDLGANDGEFTEILSQYFSIVVGIDRDPAAVDALYRRFKTGGSTATAAVLELLDPSGPRGWQGAERLAWADRDRPQMTMWLAVIHHLSITGAVPLERVVRAAVDAAPWSIIEWVDPSDPQVDLLMAGLDQHDRLYSWEVFERGVAAAGRIVETRPVSATRDLVLVKRR